MKRQPLFWFYLLFGYISLQFCWWGWQLIVLYQRYYGLQGNLDQVDFSQELRAKVWMVTGEGIVFLIILFLAVRFIHSRVMREVRLARQQKNFLLAISHELRSPLAGISMQIETLRKRSLTPEQSRSLLDQAAADTERLSSITSNIMLSYSLDENRHQLSRDKFELRAEAESILKSFQGSKNQVKVNIISDGELIIHSDRVAVVAIVRNLLENAMKYGGDDIQVVLSAKNSTVSIRVADNGPGIPAGEQQLIFNRFYRGGNEETRKARGTGLGLYIVKTLTEKLKGSIRVYGNEPRGVVFEVIIPNA